MLRLLQLSLLKYIRTLQSATKHGHVIYVLQQTESCDA